MRVLKGPSAAGQDDVKSPIPEFLRERKCVHGIHFEHDPWILLYERFAQGSWPQAVEPRSEGVSGDPRRYGVGVGQRCCAEVRVAVRSRGAVDRGSQGTGILRLLGQLSHRRE